jgi:lipopolysaccharide/colanic/teichoic acid biosynthesis glycosyltransferase
MGQSLDKILDFIFYRSERVGLHGKRFIMWKFRTMQRDSDKCGSFSVAYGDGRVIPFGRFLRKWHLDELPNLLTVLRGDMAIIGPRPDIPEYADRMPEPERTIILSVKPGCIDFATLWNFNEGMRLERAGEDPDKYYEEVIWPEKLKRQREFILKWLNPCTKKCTE